jgi:hypothetical protein
MFYASWLCGLHGVQTGPQAHPASYQMSIGAVSPGIKRPDREDDH